MARARDLVREGYDELADTYAEMRNQLSPRDAKYLGFLFDRVPSGSRVLDLGCGSGIPTTKSLAQHFQVTGLDFSEKQVALARERVPEATFVVGDMTEASFPARSFDAICAILSMIHVPREYHADLFLRIHRLLKEGGLLLVTLGADDWVSGKEDRFLGVRMYWSHFSPEVSKELIRAAGFQILRASIERAEFDGEVEEHLYVLAQKKKTGRVRAARRHKGGWGSPGRPGAPPRT